MRKKLIIALVAATVMALGTVGVLALDYFVSEDASNVTSRFFVLESDESGNEFSMVSEDGELVINITDNTLIYFEDFVPLSDDCDGMTQMVREVLFGRTLAEVLEGRNLQVIFEESEHIEPTSIMILFETITTLPEVIYYENFTPLQETPHAGFSGVIIEVAPFYEVTEEGEEIAVEGKYYVLVTNSSFTMLENGSFEETYIGSVKFIADQDTLLYPKSEIAELEKGLPITGFFDPNLPIPYTYPPQHFARVMITGHLFLNPANQIAFYAVDRFDADLKAFNHPIQVIVNDEGELSPEIEIIFEDGTPFEGDITELENSAMLVLSGPVPSQIPGADPQIVKITPNKIIILSEREILFIQPDDSWQGGLLLTQEELDEMWDNMFNPETVEIIVNETFITSPKPFIDREVGVVMVPVAYIAEALGYIVQGEGFEMIIGRYGAAPHAIAFVEGKDAYMIGRFETINLGAPPAFVDGTLFVPLSFFGQVIEANAWIMGGEVVISNIHGDDMH